MLAQLERCRAYPDFNNYLVLILAQGNSLQLEVGPESRMQSAQRADHLHVLLQEP